MEKKSGGGVFGYAYSNGSVSFYLFPCYFATIDWSEGCAEFTRITGNEFVASIPNEKCPRLRAESDKLLDIIEAIGKGMRKSRKS